VDGAEHGSCGVLAEHVCEHDIGALLGECDRNRPSDTAGAAGHDGNLA
jgi:hypothetical protein